MASITQGARVVSMQNEIVRSPQRLENGLREAKHFQAQGQFDKAERRYRRLLKDWPGAPETLRLLGLAQVQSGRLNEGIATMAEAARADPSDPYTQNNLGGALGLTNRREEALACFDKAVALKPDYAEALANRAKLLRLMDRPSEALASYDALLNLGRESAEALHGRALCLFELGRLVEAEAAFRTAKSFGPPWAELHNDYGRTLRRLGRAEEALRSYDLALALVPGFVDALNNRANALLDLGRSDEALQSYEAALRCDPGHAEARHNRGVALSALQRLEAALEDFDAALAIRPAYRDAQVSRAATLMQLGRLEDALEAYTKITAVWPAQFDGWLNHGVVLERLGRLEDALESFARAVDLNPASVEAHYGQGVALAGLERLDEALACYERALELCPDHTQAHNNRGVVLAGLGRHETAIAAFDKVLAREPENADVAFNKAFQLLTLGRYAEGWRLHEWRKRKREPSGCRAFAQPLWSGREPIKGKTVFLHWEQGLGDTLQFCRYAKLVQARGAKVVMSVQAPLKALVARAFPGVEVLGPDLVPVDFDYHSPLMSLPLALGAELGSIPSPEGYLSAEPSLREAWRERLGPAARPRVGFVWSGNPTHKNDRNRSLPLAKLEVLLRTDVEWICLQKDLRPGEADLLQTLGARRVSDQLFDFDQTAALVAELDLVITVDTSVAHLAGALGKSVWVLLPFNPDWRWLLGRNDSPWYSGARLFRQPRPGDYDSVLREVACELARAAEAAAEIGACSCPCEPS